MWKLLLIITHTWTSRSISFKSNDLLLLYFHFIAHTQSLVHMCKQLPHQLDYQGVCVCVCERGRDDDDLDPVQEAECVSLFTFLCIAVIKYIQQVAV